MMMIMIMTMMMMLVMMKMMTLNYKVVVIVHDCTRDDRWPQELQRHFDGEFAFFHRKSKNTNGKNIQDFSSNPMKPFSHDYRLRTSRSGTTNFCGWNLLGHLKWEECCCASSATVFLCSWRGTVLVFLEFVCWVAIILWPIICKCCIVCFQ